MSGCQTLQVWKSSKAKSTVGFQKVLKSPKSGNYIPFVLYAFNSNLATVNFHTLAAL